MNRLVPLMLGFALLSVATLDRANAETIRSTLPETAPSVERQNGLRVLSNEDWRSADPDIPWSTPVIVRDDFDGDYLAVFDRNFIDQRLTAQGVVSNWSRNYIRVFVYFQQRRCGLFALLCDTLSTQTLEAKRLQVKVGEQVFTIDGDNGNFPVSDELATALANAPTGGARIRLVLEESGATTTNDIGERTVAAWRTVYGQESRSARE